MSEPISNQEYDEAHDAGESDGDADQSIAGQRRSAPGDFPPPAPQKPDATQARSEEESEGGIKPGMYNPADYAHLQVSAEIQDLFDFIGRYKPQDIPLETKLKPFIPDYIPSVGDIDAFLKIPPPDGSEDGLGLKVLDEPSGTQSDPSTLEISLQMASKEATTKSKPQNVRSIENAASNPKKISNWIQNIEEVHKKKPPPVVTYSKPMPHVNRLMKAWPEEFESQLQQLALPTSALNLDVNSFARVVCALLDVPVYDKVVESLHVVFSLYSEFQNNVHFQQ